MKKTIIIIAIFVVTILFTYKIIEQNINTNSIVSPRRGINLSEVLEIPRGNRRLIMKQEYFKNLKGKGFDTIRIPIRWSDYSDDSSPYKINQEIFDDVDWMVNQCIINKLIVIIDIHNFSNLMNNPHQEKMKFLSLWSQISDHYKGYPKNLYFELLNEPTGNISSELWNVYLNEAIPIIREKNPSRVIVVGTMENNTLKDQLNQLRIPKEDKNIMVTFHYYFPINFTHQGAEWVDGSDKWIGTTWTGSLSEKNIIIEDFQNAKDWSDKNKIKLILGEFGSYNKADIDSRIKWTGYIARIAERHNISWAYWEFQSGFGIYNADSNKWRINLLEALIP